LQKIHFPGLSNCQKKYQQQQSSFTHWLFSVKLPNYFISFLNKWNRNSRLFEWLIDGLEGDPDSYRDEFFILNDYFFYVTNCIATPN